jgi:hypothetical protein
MTRAVAWSLGQLPTRSLLNPFFILASPHSPRSLCRHGGAIRVRCMAALRLYLSPMHAVQSAYVRSIGRSQTPCMRCGRLSCHCLILSDHLHLGAIQPGGPPSLRGLVFAILTKPSCHLHLGVRQPTGPRLEYYASRTQAQSHIRVYLPLMSGFGPFIFVFYDAAERNSLPSLPCAATRPPFESVRLRAMSYISLTWQPAVL